MKVATTFYGFLATLGIFYASGFGWWLAWPGPMGWVVMVGFWLLALSIAVGSLLVFRDVVAGDRVLRVAATVWAFVTPVVIVSQPAGFLVAFTVWVCLIPCVMSAATVRVEEEHLC